jgi:hypothetical protein
MTQVPGVALLGALAMLGSVAMPAMADAPIPIPGTTKVDSDHHQLGRIAHGDARGSVDLGHPPEVSDLS